MNANRSQTRRATFRTVALQATVALGFAFVWCPPAPVSAVIVLPAGEEIDWSFNGYLDSTSLSLQEEAPDFNREPEAIEKAPAPTEARVSLRLHKPTSLRPGFVTIRDIAKLSGPETDLLEEIGDLQLVATPEPGEKKFIFARRVEAALRRLGLARGDFELLGPDRVALDAPSQTVSMEIIENVLNDALNKRANETRDGKVEAFLTRQPPKLHLPLGELEIEVVDLDRPGSGLRTIQLAFLVDGQKVGTRAVSARVNHKVYGIVAARELESGDILLEDDLTEGLVPVRERSDDVEAQTDASMLIGTNLVRSIRAGDPITLSDVESIPIMERGDSVLLFTRAGTVSMTAPGVLLEDAYRLGQMVEVRKRDSRDTFFGKVHPGGKIEVR